MIAPGTTSDTELIAASLISPDRFAEIFDRHFQTIHRYLARRSRVAVADDLSSQTFLVAFRRRASFRSEGDTALPWLYGIASRLLLNHLRAERSSRQVLQRLRATQDVQTPSADARSGGPGDERLALVAVALQTLSDEQREILLLHAWAELTYEEIAEGLAIPVGTVRSRLARARAQLRAVVDSEMTQTEEARP